MRKKSAIILSIMLAITMTACGDNVQNKSTQKVIKNQEQSSSESNILIAYFTVPETDGVDTVSSASRVTTDEGVLGNTEFIATEIQKNLGGDLFAIQTVQEYPGTHDALLEFAYNEKTEKCQIGAFHTY